MTYSREEVEAYLAIFDSVTDEMAEGWKEGETSLPVKMRILADLNTIIQTSESLVSHTYSCDFDTDKSTYHCASLTMYLCSEIKTKHQSNL